MGAFVHELLPAFVVNLNINTAGAEEDFSQIAAIATFIGDRKWENRAAGELGIVAGI